MESILYCAHLVQLLGKGKAGGNGDQVRVGGQSLVAPER
jgi:hypothetical protein